MVALALIVLAAGIVVATPGAREAVARRLGLRGVAIHLGGPAPTTPALPPGVGANLGLGRRVTLRLAGSTLLWTHGEQTLRLEGQLSKAEALRVAASMR